MRSPLQRWRRRWRAWRAQAAQVRQSLRGGPGYQGRRSDHFDGERFFNPGAPAGKSWLDVLRWWSTRQRRPWPRWRDERAHPELARRLAPEEVAITFINHATFLVQLPGCTLITDPVYAVRPGPVRWAGPRRAHEPGVPFERLPHVDLVCVSHNHYDHLDVPTLLRLARVHAPVFVTGLGNAAFLRQQGIAQVVELDWWQQRPLRDLQLIFTPAQHWSDRGMSRNRTLWAGLWVRSEHGQLYFSGDTGYAPLFGELRARLGSPDVALLPIGCYEPRWFMCTQHMNPEEAVRVHLDLGARWSIGCHFGCFRLTDEGIDDPLIALHEARRRLGVKAEAFCAPQPGTTLRLRLGGSVANAASRHMGCEAGV